MKKTITITIDTDSPDVVVNTLDKVDDGGYRKPTFKETIRRHLDILVDIDRRESLEGREKPLSALKGMERVARFVRETEDKLEAAFKRKSP